MTIKSFTQLHHVRPTAWFIGACENVGCENASVKWSGKSQAYLCWSCTSDATYKVLAGTFSR